MVGPEGFYYSSARGLQREPFAAHQPLPQEAMNEPGAPVAMEKIQERYACLPPQVEGMLTLEDITTVIEWAEESLRQGIFRSDHREPIPPESTLRTYELPQLYRSFYEQLTYGARVNEVQTYLTVLKAKLANME